MRRSCHCRDPTGDAAVPKPASGRPPRGHLALPGMPGQPHRGACPDDGIGRGRTPARRAGRFGARRAAPRSRNARPAPERERLDLVDEFVPVPELRPARSAERVCQLHSLVAIHGNDVVGLDRPTPRVEAPDAVPPFWGSLLLTAGPGGRGRIDIIHHSKPSEFQRGVGRMPLKRPHRDIASPHGTPTHDLSPDGQHTSYVVSDPVRPYMGAYQANSILWFTPDGQHAGAPAGLEASRRTRQTPHARPIPTDQHRARATEPGREPVPRRNGDVNRPASSFRPGR